MAEKSRAEWEAEAQRLRESGDDPQRLAAIESALGEGPAEPVQQAAPAPVPQAPATPAESSFFPGLARSFYQGFTVGTGDEAEAGLRQVLPGHTYGEDLDIIQGEQRAFERDYPVTSFAADFAGGMLSPVNLITPGVGPEASLARRTAATALRGAAEGAVEGAARAEGGALDRGLGGAEGAAWGLALNPAFQGLAQLLPVLYRGGKALVRPFFEAPADTASRQVGSLLSAGQDTAEDIAQRLDDLGETAMLADVNPQTRELAAAARGRSDVAARTLDEATMARQETVQPRIRGYLEEAAGESAESARDTRIRLADEIAQYGNEAYPTIDRIPINPEGEINRIMETPYVKRLADRVRASFQSEYRTGRDPFQMNERTQTAPLMVYDRLKQMIDARLIELDNTVQKTQSASAKDELRVLGDLRRKFVDALDRQATPMNTDRSKYAVVREGHERLARQASALDQGSRLARTRDQALDDMYEQMFGIQNAQTRTMYDSLAERNQLPARQRIDAFREGEQVPFRQGAVESMVREAERAGGPYANPAGRLMRGADAQERLELLARTPEANQRLQQQLTGEMEQFETMRLLNPATQSRTAILEAASERAEETAQTIQNVATAATGSPEGILSVALQKLRRPMTRESANEVANLLTQSGMSVQQIDELMNANNVPEEVRDTVRRFMEAGGERAARAAARTTVGRLAD